MKKMWVQIYCIHKIQSNILHQGTKNFKVSRIHEQLLEILHKKKPTPVTNQKLYFWIRKHWKD